MRASTISLLAASVGSASAALKVDLKSTSSIKEAVKDVASDAVSYYQGSKPNNIPGILDQQPPAGKYWWWTGSVLWSTLLDHWRYTGDETYNGLISQGLLHQKGPNNDFIHHNWTASLSEDDLGFWAMAAMQAAELDFPAPSQDGLKNWVDLASNVFAGKVVRYDEATCNGGFHWQLSQTNVGYNYKNAISSAVFINLGARLSRYTGNGTYAELAEESWKWLTEVGYIDEDSKVFDGAHVEQNCTDINKAQFSYNAAVLLEGAAHLYNSTTGEAQTRWRNRLAGMANTTLDVFFPNGTHVEIPCESLTRKDACTGDMKFFKGITLRSLANVAQLAPFLRDGIVKTFKTNAEAAVKTCTGGDNDRQCGFSWLREGDDGLGDAAGALNVLTALDVLLIDDVAQKVFAKGSVSSGSSGSSSGNGMDGGDAQQQKPSGSAGSVTGVTAVMILAGLFAALM